MEWGGERAGQVAEHRMCLDLSAYFWTGIFKNLISVFCNLKPITWYGWMYIKFSRQSYIFLPNLFYSLVTLDMRFSLGQEVVKRAPFPYPWLWVTTDSCSRWASKEMMATGLVMLCLEESVHFIPNWDFLKCRIMSFLCIRLPFDWLSIIFWGQETSSLQS